MRKLTCFIVAMGAFSAISTRALDGSWSNNADGTWANTGNWVGGVVATGTHFTARFTNAVTATRTVTLDAASSNVTIGNLLWGSPGNSNWNLSAGTINLAVTSGIPTVTVNGGVVAIGTRLAGAQGLNKAGAGLLALTTTNAWSGGTLISAGTLQIGNYGDTGALPPGAVTNNGALIVARTNDLVLANPIVGTGALTYNGSTNQGVNSILTLTGTNNFGGAVTVTTGSLAITHSLALGTSNKTVTLSNGTAGNPILLLDGSGGDISLPPGITLILSNSRGTVTNVAGNNTLNGPIQVTSGGGSGFIRISGGSLLITNGVSITQPNRDFIVGGVNTGRLAGVVSATVTNAWLSKVDSGLWIVTGSNTYPGSTVISGGTLQIGDNSAAGTLSTNSVVNNAQLVFKRSDAYALANVLTGTGSLVQAGSGLLTLTAISTMSGPTYISNATLAVNGQLTNGPIIVEAGSRLTGTNRVGNVTVRGAISPGVGAGQLLGGDNISLESGGRYEIDINNFSGAAATAWDLISFARVTNNATSPNPFIFELRSLSGSNVGQAANFNGFQGYTIKVANVSAGLTTGLDDPTRYSVSVSNFQNAWVGSWSLQTNALDLSLVYSPAALADTANYTWDASNDVANAQDGSGTWSQSGTNWWDGAQTVTWSNGVANFGAGGGGSYNVAVAADGVLAAGLTFNAGSTYALNGPGAIGLAPTATISADADATVGTTLSGISLTKAGTGTVTLAGEATAFSGIQINAGRLQVGNGGTSGALAATVTNNATLAFNRSNLSYFLGSILGTGTVELNGTAPLAFTAANTLSGPVVGSGTLWKQGLGTLTFTGTAANAASGELVGQNGTINLAKPAGIAAWSGPIHLTNDPTVSVVLQSLASDQIPDTTVMRFSRQGSQWPFWRLLGNTETVAGLSCLTGQGVIENTESEAAAYPVASLIVSNDTDQTFDGYIRNRSGGNAANYITFAKWGVGTQTLIGSLITYTGSTRVAQGTLVLSNTTAFASDISNSATVVFRLTNALNYSIRQLSGPGTFIKEGASTLRLDATNRYTGVMIISNGYIDCYGDGSLATNTPVYVESPQGLVLYQGSTQWVASINGTSTAANIFGNTAGRTGVVVSLTTGNSTYNGRVYQGSGPVRIAMAGSGEQTLGGTVDNSSCNVEVQSGTLTLAKVSSPAIHAAAGSAAVLGGTLKLAGVGADQIHSNAPVSMSGGVFDLNGRNEGVFSLLGAGGTIRNDAAGTTAELKIGEGNGSGTNASVIADGIGTTRLVKVGTGLQVLSGASTFSGGASLSGGTLRVSSASGVALGHGNADVAATAMLDGTGRVGRVTLRDQGQLSAGENGVGGLTTTNLTVGGGAAIRVDVMDFAGIAGATNGADLVTVQGPLLVTASAAQRAILQLRTVNSANATGTAVNFNAALGYTVTVVSASAGITGFSAQSFTLDLAGFVNAYAGSWTVAQSGGDVQVVYTPGVVDTDPVEAWTNTLALTFCGYDKAETLTNFPALILLSKVDSRGVNMYEMLADPVNGNDLRFTVSGATTNFLNYEIEKWDTNGVSYVWVQVPELSAGSQIEIRGGNANAVGGRPLYAINGSTWSNGYLSVWHFNGGSAQDALRNYNGTRFGTPVYTLGGLAGDGLSFNGTDQYVQLPAGMDNFTNGLTIEAWWKPQVAANWSRIVDFGRTAATNNIVLARNGTSQNVRFEHYGSVAGTETFDVAGNPIPGLGTWAHWMLTHSAGASNDATAQFYMDGTLRGVKTDSSVPPLITRTTNLIGKSNWATDALANGSMDELRISIVPRSSNWAYATWLTMVAPNAFYCIATEDRTMYRDEDETTPGRQDGGGTWNFVGNKWMNQFGANRPWLQRATAILGNGTNSTATNVLNAAETIYLAGLTFTNGAAYVITGNTGRLVFPAVATNFASRDAEIQARVSGSGFVKTGPARLWLNPVTGANDYTGAIKVAEGTLLLGGTTADGTIRGDLVANPGATIRLTAANPVYNLAQINLDSGATLDLNGQSDAIGSIAGAGFITNNNVNFHVDDQARNAVFSGNMDLGTGGFYVRALSSSGAQTLSGTNRFGTIGIERNGANLILGGGSNSATFVGIGQQADGGTLSLANGAVLSVNGSIQLGEQVSRHGETHQTNGVVSLSGQIRVGHWSTETSIWRMLAGSIAFTAEAGATPFGASGTEQNGTLYIGIDGTGLFYLLGGSVRASAIVLDNRGDTAGTDLLVAEGGSINLGRWGISGNASTLILLGGTELQGYQSWTSTLPFSLTGTNGATVFNPGTNTIVLNAGASGTGGLTVAASGGRLVLAGTSTYSGQTSVSNGTLVVNGFSTSSTVQVDTAGALAGTGTVGTAVIAGTLAPGSVVGRLNALDLTMQAGSRYEMDINNFSGTAGTGWDLVTMTGTLSAVAGPIVFDLRTLSGTTPGAAANFNGFNSYTLRVATVNGTLAFDATNALVVTTNFLNAYIGSWSVQTNGPTIEVVYAPAATPNPSAVAVWDASNDVFFAQDGTGVWDITTSNWWDTGSSANILWNNGTAIFGFGSTSTDSFAITVSAPGVLAESLIFSAGPRYTISGPGSIGLQGAQSVVADSATEISSTLSGALLLKQGADVLTLSGDASSFSAYQIDAGTLKFGAGGTSGALNPLASVANQGVLAFDKSVAQAFSGNVSGPGEINKRGSGTLTLSGTNSFTGATRVLAGTLQLGGGRALGDTSGGTFVSDGATLDLASQVAGTNGASEVLTIAGWGVNSNGALVSSGAASPAQMARYLVVTGETRIGGSGPGWIAIDGNNAAGSGYIAGGTNTLEKVGANAVVVRAGIAVTVGVINVRSGNLSMESSSTLNNDYALNVYTGGLFYGFNWTQTLGRAVGFAGGTLQALSGTLNATGTFTAQSSGILFAQGAINHTGTITGAGGLLVNANGTTSIVHLAGSNANTAAGELTLFNGTTRFDKPAGVNAWAGSAIVLSNNPSASCALELLNNEQIADTTVLRFLRQGSAYPYAKLLGRTETVAGLDSPSLGVLENTEGENSTGTDGTIVVNNAADYTFAGYLRDKAAAASVSTNRIHLRKLGAGRQTLAGTVIGDANSLWSGWVSVDQGTLCFSNTFSTGLRVALTNNANVELVSSQSASASAQLGQSATRLPLLAGAGAYTADGLIMLQGEFSGSGSLDIRSGRLGNDNRGGIWTNCSAAVTVHGGAVWDMRATMLQCGSLRGSGTVLNSYFANPGGATNLLTIGFADGSGAFYGSIVGNVGVDASSNGLINVSKVGTGTQILAGVNSYGGTTSISNGTLLVHGTLGTGNVYVASLGTLGGTGSISGAVGLAGTLAPGSSAGRLTVNGLVVSNSGVIAIEVAGATQGTTHDHLVVTAPAALGGTLAVTVSTGYTPAAGATFTVLTATALSGSFLNVTNGGTVTNGSIAFKVHYGSGSLFNANEVVLENVTANPDSDGDGLPDAWELANFASLTNATATSQTDADGVSDFDEFIAGTDPNSAVSFLRFTNELRSVAGNILFWPSTTSRLYDVEWSTNAVSGLWTPVASNLPSTPPANSYTNGTGPSLQLYRLKVRIGP